MLNLYRGIIKPLCRLNISLHSCQGVGRAKMGPPSCQSMQSHPGTISNEIMICPCTNINATEGSFVSMQQAILDFQPRLGAVVGLCLIVMAFHVDCDSLFRYPLRSSILEFRNFGLGLGLRKSLLVLRCCASPRCSGAPAINARSTSWR